MVAKYVSVPKSIEIGNAGRAVLWTARRNSVAPKPVSTAQAVVMNGMMPWVAALDTNTLKEEEER